MSKRGGDQTRRVNPQAKKRKGVRVQTIIVLDSDDECTPSNATTDYVRLVRTRVTLSSKAGSVTASIVPFLEAEDPPTSQPEAVIDNSTETTGESIVHEVRTT